MRTLKAFWACQLALLFSASLVFAQNTESPSKVGTTAAQFLKIGAGARAIGLGGAFTALAEGIDAIYWNPAGIARVGGLGEATFNHANWLAETDYDFAAFSVNLGDLGTVGFHVISFRVPEQIVRTVQFPQGTGQVWDANSIALGITFARNLTDRFSIGITGKFIRETLFNENAQGGAFDLGIVYQTPWNNLQIGASITNFGTKMRLDGRDIFFNEDPLPQQGPVDQVPSKFRLDAFEIPLNLRFGIAWRAYKDNNMEITLLADGTHPNDNRESINSGIEVALKRVIYLRSGYKALFLPNSEQGLTFGAGLRYDAVGTNVRIDFGWADYGRLNDVKFFSLTIGY
ncbi:MAG: hypothetical protein D6814_17565 [Calditrichaeota bacterium]|nr:MAG: hypothetical protein D6814_17565 [Calditrichota bacterium]